MDWVWLAVFVGLMFAMNRFGMGCCGGHGHGGHGGHWGHGHGEHGEDGDNSRSEQGEVPKTGKTLALAPKSPGMNCCGGGHREQSGEDDMAEKAPRPRHEAEAPNPVAISAGPAPERNGKQGGP